METTATTDRPRYMTATRRNVLAILAKRDSQPYDRRTTRSVATDLYAGATHNEIACTHACLTGLANRGLVEKVQDGEHLTSWRITDTGRDALKGRRR